MVPDTMTKISGKCRGSVTTWLLFAANLVLLGVVWFVSISAYGRLAQHMSSWSSVWTGHPVMVERSWTFFFYPTVQAAFFVAAMGLAAALFLKRHRSGPEGSPPASGQARRVWTLRGEVVYLALIFFNLLFIHLQTSRILLSHQIGRGINRLYFAMLLVMILFILGPYYRIRLKIIRSEGGGSSGPR
jgi:hypothetical protein